MSVELHDFALIAGRTRPRPTSWRRERPLSLLLRVGNARRVGRGERHVEKKM